MADQATIEFHIWSSIVDKLVQFGLLCRGLLDVSAGVPRLGTGVPDADYDNEVRIMNLAGEVQRSIYATVGAGQWATAALRELWQDPQGSFERAEDAYQRLAERGETVLAHGRRQARQQGDEIARAARRAPGVAPIEGEVVGGLSESDDRLPIPDYENLTVAQIVSKLPELTQRELHQIEGYERRHHGRSTILQKVEELRGAEPWAGYDEMTVEEIIPRLRDMPSGELDDLMAHERRHKNRSTVIQAAQRAGD
ncbi:MAG: hypothetical protein ACRDQ5_13105 [Sciscionella sp.]